MVGRRDRGKWWRGWIQVLSIWYMVITFVYATMYPCLAKQLKWKKNNWINIGYDNKQRIYLLKSYINICQNFVYLRLLKGLEVMINHANSFFTLAQNFVMLDIIIFFINCKWFSNNLFLSFIHLLSDKEDSERRYYASTSNLLTKKS
jgi:hypothetical protein